MQCTSQFVDVPLWKMETVTFVLFDVRCRGFFRWVAESSRFRSMVAVGVRNLFCRDLLDFNS